MNKSLKNSLNKLNRAVSLDTGKAQAVPQAVPQDDDVFLRECVRRYGIRCCSDLYNNCPKGPQDVTRGSDGGCRTCPDCGVNGENCREGQLHNDRIKIYKWNGVFWEFHAYVDPPMPQSVPRTPSGV
jgi:hypothetical protein